MNGGCESLAMVELGGFRHGAITSMELTLAVKAHCCRRPRASPRMGRGACPLPAMVDPRALGTRGGCSRLPSEQGDRRAGRRPVWVCLVLRIHARDLWRGRSGDHA